MSKFTWAHGGHLSVHDGDERTQLEDMGVRVETGALKIGTSPRGLFIRGDEAMGLAQAIDIALLDEQRVAKSGNWVLLMARLRDLRRMILEDVNEHAP